MPKKYDIDCNSIVKDFAFIFCPYCHTELIIDIYGNTEVNLNSETILQLLRTENHPPLPEPGNCRCGRRFILRLKNWVEEIKS
jgi:hypothetical protein